MSTFLHHCHLHQTQINNITNHLSTNQKNSLKALTLTQKGLKQAHRNDSTEIWKVIYNCQQLTQADSCNQSLSQDYIDQSIDKSFKRSPKNSENQESNQKHDIQINEQKNKQIKNQVNHDKISKKTNNKNKPNKKEDSKKSLNTQKKQNFLVQSEQKNLLQTQNLKKMNDQIIKHLHKQKHCSRNLSNSAFAKLYNRPCIQSYGYGNISKQSQASNNLLKTHNITPHTLENNPSTYQAYKNSINFAKRTKISHQNKQQRIRRQFLKWFDDSIVEAAQNQLNIMNKARSKSEQNYVNKVSLNERSDQSNNEENQRNTKIKRENLKKLLGSNQPTFIYKYKDSDGQIRCSKDRHGVKCYVDSSFPVNQKPLINFKKNLNPIYPQKVKDEDMNIDLIRKQNYQKSVEENYLNHYLVLCVVTPYEKAKYQFRKKRKQSALN